MVIGIDASRGFVEQKTGTEMYTYELLRELLMLPEAQKHQWVLYCRKGQSSKVAEVQRLCPSATMHTLNLPYLWTQVGLAYRTWVDQLNVLWVPAHTLPIVRKPGLKTVVTVHGIEYEYLPAYENWLQRWYLPLSTQYAVHSASKIIAVSEFTKKQLIERLGATPQKISVIYEGAGGNGQTPSHKSQTILQKFKLQKNKYILFVGTIQPRKNLRRLIEAFAMTKSQIPNPNLKLVIAGKWGWGYEDIPKDAENVFFTGYIDDAEKATLLHNAVMCIQPSITEGFGLPVIEAMCAGKPVIISSGGALPELVPHPWPMFDPVNVKDIAEKMQQVLGDAKLRLELVQRGRRKAMEFTWRRAATKTLEVLESVGSGKV